jgi:hypothetical protein
VAHVRKLVGIDSCSHRCPSPSYVPRRRGDASISNPAAAATARMSSVANVRKYQVGRPGPRMPTPTKRTGKSTVPSPGNASNVPAPSRARNHLGRIRTSSLALAISSTATGNVVLTRLGMTMPPTQRRTGSAVPIIRPHSGLPGCAWPPLGCRSYEGLLKCSRSGCGESQSATAGSAHSHMRSPCSASGASSASTVSDGCSSTMSIALVTSQATRPS